jgi:thiol-disulfide isomerase/thioredoxin
MSADDKCALVENETDLDKALKDKDKVIAFVYATWCPFCRKILPAFQELAQDGRRNFLLVADDEELIAEKYVIDVFPTLLFFNKGAVALRLDGKPGVGLNEKQIKDFIKSCPLPEA